MSNYAIKSFLYFGASIATWEIGYRIVALFPENVIKNAIMYIGKNTMPIIFLNFISFKVIIWLQIKLYQLPQYYLAAFPSYAHDWWWKFFVCSVGILIPLGANIVYKEIVTHSTRKIENE